MFAGYNGFLPSNGKPTKFKDVKDGLSNTIMCGEWDYDMETYLWSSRGSCAGQIKYGSHRWGGGYPGVALGNTSGKLNAGRFEPYSGNNRLTWRSDHVGGVHILLGDGAIRFLNESTDADLIDGLSTIGKGEVPGEF